MNTTTHKSVEARIIYLLVLSAVFFFFFSLLFWEMKEIEIRILVWHNPVYENPSLMGWWKWITRYGLNIITATEGVLILLSLKLEHFRSFQPALLCALLVYTIGWFAEDWLKELIARDRPAVALAGQIAHTFISDSFSYPSGHATKAMSLVLPFLFIASGKKPVTVFLKLFLGSIAALVCYSRIPLQLHYPSDLFGGAGLASTLTLIALPATHRIDSKWPYGFKTKKYFYFLISLVFLFLAVLFLII